MRLDVWLVGFKPGSTPAKSLAGTFGIDLQEALMLEWSVPTIVGRDLGEGDAESAVRTLRGIGALAEGRPVDPAAPLGFELPFEKRERVRASTPEPPAGVNRSRFVRSRAIEPPVTPSGRRARVPDFPGVVVADPASHAEIPGTVLPDTALPGTVLPGTVSPDTALPGTALPDTALPTTRRGTARTRTEILDDDEPSEDGLPSLPAPRRPRVAEKERDPAPKPLRSSQGEAPPAPRPDKSERATKQRATRPEKVRPRKSPQMFDAGPPLELLEVERTERRPEAIRPSSTSPVSKRAGTTGIAPLLPALGVLAVGAAATFITLRRGQTAMLGTADLVGHALDGLAIGCFVLALVLAASALFSGRDHLHLAPGLLALGLAVGAAYVVNEWRIPNVGPDAELGGEASGLITQSQVSLARFEDTEARSLLSALHDAGAISIRGAAPVRFLGAEAFHGLAIELPPGPRSRARIIEAFRGAMLLRGGSTTPDPSPTQVVWVVAL